VAEAGGSGHHLVERGRLEGCAKVMRKIDKVCPFTGQDRVEVLWRTLICDVDVSSGSPPPPEWGTAFRASAGFLTSKALMLAEKSWFSREEYMETIKAVDELARADAKRLGVMPGFKRLRKTERRDRKRNRGLGYFRVRRRRWRRRQETRD
jgi:hypothetical protein